MNLLITKAKTQKPGSAVEPAEATSEEMELFMAYMNGDVTSHQCYAALERSRGYFYNWCRRCAFHLWKSGRVIVRSSADARRDVRFWETRERRRELVTA